MGYELPTMASKFKGLYKGTTEDIPALPDDYDERVQALIEKDTPENNSIDSELMALAMLRSANVMKSKIGDGIDEVEQIRKAKQSMDCYLGKLIEAGIDPNTYL